MVLVTSNKSKQLLLVSYIGVVRVAEFQQGREDITAQLEELSPGFSLLTDFSQMELMEADCVPALGRMMEQFGEAGAGLVVRVIPDPRKDIGMNILTAFHYPNHPQIVVCENLTQAARALGL